MENDRRQWWSLLGREGSEGEGVKKDVINSILNTIFYVYCSLLEDLCTESVLTKKKSKQASNENVGKNSWRHVTKSWQTDSSASSQRINSKPVTDRINKPLMRIGQYKPERRCTTTLILVFFVLIMLVATQSYKPLSAGLKFLMVSIPLFTSVLPAGKGNSTDRLQVITGRGYPSA